MPPPNDSQRYFEEGPVLAHRTDWKPIAERSTAQRPEPALQATTEAPSWWRQVTRRGARVFLFYALLYPLLVLCVVGGIVGGFIGGFWLDWHAIRLAGNAWLALVSIPYATGFLALLWLMRAESFRGASAGALSFASNALGNAASRCTARLLLSLSISGSLALPAFLFLSRRVPADAALICTAGTAVICASLALWAFVLESDWLEPRTWLEPTAPSNVWIRPSYWPRREHYIDLEAAPTRTGG
ncbi:hypothetical protein CYME_CMD066C [Cyanidioschyzon merolae strain 10D]|jgi:hypothetical protein|uniref:Uncharacterized protein n=1 Tax=Cyanidioschyzon merolae (strain NIES-3377 / 10D) TaxID=280699 RepID=M1VAJ2_CYAM1|nr:hypothetical protein CYME_CMD066C [Cyanidioschyzon merolae strain 10D]BAM79147.1 hypothetical protein CYME_CMD066C [Cyanidioschyzon merolae strain 10D]|eukprot:XP_005535433.1 hypothetical protein CYME_CMD066C [Cyanidioschyzon merolae strain 10D]